MFALFAEQSVRFKSENQNRAHVENKQILDLFLTLFLYNLTWFFFRSLQQGQLREMQDAPPHKE